jgi:hypothetical protein
MNVHKLRNRIAAAASLGAAVSATALMIGGGVASAAPPSDPPGGSTPVYPHFYNGNVEGIRDSGSDTTFFMMQSIGDLYTSAGLYGCTLNGATGQSLYNSLDADTAGASGTFEFYCRSTANADTTDTSDNWDRTEVTQGVDDVGSGAGQNQLCGASTLTTPLTVDFARSSKPVVTAAACDEVGTGYAKDGVPVVDFPTVNPASYGTSTFSGGVGGVSYASVNGGNIGKVANGWLPGDPTTGGGTHGTALANISDINANPSEANGIWCTGTIKDWGQLTNLGGTTTTHLLAVVGVTVSNTGPGGDAVLTLPASATTAFPVTTFPSFIQSPGGASGADIASGSTVVSGAGTNTITLSAPATTTGGPTTVDFKSTAQAAGSGLPYGLPIRVIGVNTASGTEATFQGFANFPTNPSSGGACASQVPAAGVVEVDPNGATNSGDNSGGHTALENNASQIALFDSTDFPITGSGDTNDAANQAIELATTLYFESNGVFNTNPHSAQADITFNGTTTAFSASQVPENGLTPTTQRLLINTYPTARTLFNIYQTSSVRASTAGFLNWICDSNTYFQKQNDTTTGSNYDGELNNIIGGQYGFIRLTDQSVETSGTPNTFFTAPDGSCGVEATGSLSNGNTLVIPDTAWGKYANPPTAAATPVPSEITNGLKVVGPDLDNVNSPNPGDTIQTITGVTDNGTNTTITLSSEADNTNSVGSEQITIGLPPVLQTPASAQS